jgi:methylaspartate ammonia-lyase
LLRARIAEEDIAAARAAHEATSDRVFMEDIKPGMSLDEKKRIANHILRLQAQR